MGQTDFPLLTWVTFLPLLGAAVLLFLNKEKKETIRGVPLTSFFTLVSVIACWKDIQEKVKEFMVCLLFLETGMIGVFVALDLFLFYVFWEVMLIPMYLLIGVWGNPKRRIYAAVKFFIYTMVGSVLMLVAILVLYFHNGAATGTYTFDLLQLYKLQVPLDRK